MLENLQELKDLNQRQAQVNFEVMLNEYKELEQRQKERDQEEDERETKYETDFIRICTSVKLCFLLQIM